MSEINQNQNLMINQNEKDKRNSKAENLRTEYQTAQQAANNETVGYWAFAGIFLAFSSAILAVVVNFLINNTKVGHLRFMVTALAIGMWVIYLALWFMLERVNRRQRKFFDRMEKIETELDGDMKLTTIRKNVSGISGQTLYAFILIVFGAFWLVALVLVLN